MKKVFELTHPKIKMARRVESVRADVNRYLKRERNKPLPKGTDYWDFDCKFGRTAEVAEVVHVSELSKRIGQAADDNILSFYIEILAKPGFRSPKDT